MSTIKAKPVNLTIGELNITALLLPDGTRGYTFEWLATLIGKDKSILSDKKSPFYLPTLGKGALGADFTSRRVLVEGISKAKLSWVTDIELMRLFKALIALGHLEVLDLLTACAVEALDTRFDAALGLEPKTIVQQNYIMSHRIKKITKADRLAIFKYWDDIIWERLGEREPGCLHPRKYCRMMNELLFGVQNFRFDRDNMTPLQQDAVFAFEEFCCDEYFRNPRQTVNQIFQKAIKWAAVVKDSYKIAQVLDKDELGDYTPIKEHHATRKAREIRESEDAEIRAGLELFLAKKEFTEEDLSLLDKLANQ